MNKLDPVNLAGQAAEAKKAEDVVILNIQGVSSFADFFVLATGLNKIHTRAIAEHVEEELAKHGVLPFSKQGYQEGEWILLDYLEFVVHIFIQEARDYYQLERLWQRD
ncbi:MAG: ribosome silencing factor [Bacillota bacterium]|jgi:ribosome-associated protein